MRTKSLKTDEDDENSKLDLNDDNEDSNDGKCSVPGCDSSGHLSGKFETHLSHKTCPIYHNLTPDDCKERYKKRLARREERNQLEANKRELRKSSSSPNKEEKCNSLMEMRRKEMQKELVNASSPSKNKLKLTKQNTSRFEKKLLFFSLLFSIIFCLRGIFFERRFFCFVFKL